jgi:4'-phosphopantetheinyl transferase
MNSPQHSVRVGEVLIGWAEVGLGAAPAVALGPADAARAAALPAERQARFLQGRALLHQLLGELQPGVVHQLDAGPCPHCGGAHGPVVVADAAAVVSLSYAADLVVAAVAPAQLISAVGLDAEPNTAGSERLTDLAKLIGGAPASALRRWTQLEAVLKADGRGLRVDPQRVLIQADQARIEGEPARYHLAEVDGAPGQVISLAWR